jgi:hypothetical protein
MKQEWMEALETARQIANKRYLAMQHSTISSKLRFCLSKVHNSQVRVYRKARPNTALALHDLLVDGYCTALVGLFQFQHGCFSIRQLHAC